MHKHKNLIMTLIIKNSCREKTSRPNSTKLNIIHSKPVLGKLISTLFSLLPTLLTGCTHSYHDQLTEDIPITLELRSSDGLVTGDHIDLFTFNNNNLMQLDSYQRVEYSGNSTLNLRSQNGNKRIFAYRNSINNITDWYNLNSYWGLQERYTELKNEQKNAFSMSGDTEALAGSYHTCKINMKPFVSEIQLQSIKCDFTGKHYEGQSIKEAKAYLINVNARCSLLYDESTNMEEVINYGELDEDIMSTFIEPSLLTQTIGTITHQTSRPAIRLFCYPNSCSKEGPGTPFTRLVIEGKISGETCWWPININRKSDSVEPGIHRNRRYIYNLTLRSKGSSGPDEPIELEDIDIDMTIKPWNEKQDYSVEF